MLQREDIKAAERLLRRIEMLVFLLLQLHSERSHSARHGGVNQPSNLHLLLAQLLFALDALSPDSAQSE